MLIMPTPFLYVPAAPSGVTVTWIGRASADVLVSSSATVDLSSVAEGDILRIGVGIVLGGSGTNQITALSLEGSAATKVVDSSDDASDQNGGSLIFSIACPAAAAGNASASFSVTGGTTANWIPGVWKIEGATGTEATSLDESVGVPSLNLNLNASANGGLVAVGTIYNNGRTITWTGATEDSLYSTGNKRVSFASAATTLQTPRTVTFGLSGNDEPTGVVETIN